MVATVDVALGERSYSVLVGEGLLEQAHHHIGPLLSRQRVAIVTEATVGALHLAALESALQKGGVDTVALTLPAGEQTKDWAHLQHCVEWLLSQKVERNDIVIALGGGVIGDLVGFAAAILRRGVRVVQLPTSLLAQVDSSVGGKTGINSPHGKNLVGAFHQPSLVLCDTTVLDSLPRRDFLAGYGEVVKYGLLGDEAFFHWLERNGPALRDGDKTALNYAVAHCCQMKADIVARDETEQGDRALLNLGHTFGHALEAATGYSERLLHGEGVAIGCALAFDLSAQLGLCSQETPSRIRAHFHQMGLKTYVTDIEGDLPDASALMALMAQDKKVVSGQLRMILARDVGAAFVSRDVPEEALLAVLQAAVETKAS